MKRSFATALAVRLKKKIDFSIKGEKKEICVCWLCKCHFLSRWKSLYVVRERWQVLALVAYRGCALSTNQATIRVTSARGGGIDLTGQSHQRGQVLISAKQYSTTDGHKHRKCKKAAYRYWLQKCVPKGKLMTRGRLIPLL